ncbi:MAG TPA: ATP-grasp domain-containing protein [Gaiellaceae bacterium]
MTTFAVVAMRATPTSSRLGTVLTPARALSRLRPGDVALGRLDVLPSLDGVEPGLWALDRLAAFGVTVLNPRAALIAAHDKLATADALAGARLPHPRTVHVAPWLPLPELDAPVVLKPRFGSWGRDVILCETQEDLERTLHAVRTRVWFNATGGVLQRLVPPRGYDLRIVVAGGRVVGAVKRVAAAGEWRTNIALGGHREPVLPPADACDLALAAADAIGGDLVGVDLLPAGVGTWTVIEVNGAVDFNGLYSFEEEIFSAVRTALRSRRPLRAVPA